MRVETHQRRIRQAVAALNRVLKAAVEDHLYLEYEPVTTENSDMILQEIKVRGWEMDEPKPHKASSTGSGDSNG